MHPQVDLLGRPLPASSEPHNSKFSECPNERVLREHAEREQAKERARADQLERQDKAFAEYVERKLKFHVDTDSQRFRFRRHKEFRALLLSTMRAANESPKKILRFLNCGADAFLDYSAHRKTYRIRTFGCSHRACPVCAKSRRAKLLLRIQTLISRAPLKQWRFVTLPLAHSDAPLEQQLAHLKASFRRLRQTHLWKRRVSGGLAVIEVTYNKRRAQWHPHIHVLAHGTFLPQRELSLAWAKATNGSYIVDVRALSGKEDAAEEIAGYFSKPPKIENLPDAETTYLEYYKATEGERLIVSFGKVPKIFEPAPPIVVPDGPDDWEPVHNAQTFFTLARARNPWASQVVNALIDPEASGKLDKPPPDDVWGLNLVSTNGASKHV